jgi:hypothetical protein
MNCPSKPPSEKNLGRHVRKWPILLQKSGVKDVLPVPTKFRSRGKAVVAASPRGGSLTHWN